MPERASDKGKAFEFPSRKEGKPGETGVTAIGGQSTNRMENDFQKLDKATKQKDLRPKGGVRRSGDLIN